MYMYAFAWVSRILYIHKLRNTQEMVEKLCPLCREEVETEEHFLLFCPALDDLREHYILPHLDLNHENYVKCLLVTKEMSMIRATSTYLYRAFRRRHEALESVEHDSFFLE